MQLVTSQPSEIVSSGAVEKKKFGIVANAKSLMLLTTTLYQNLIGSIMREVSSNAKDSHTQAGKANVPFEIHLPTVFEPWVSIRDFGVGLSNDEIFDVYINFFESTKDTSNELVGAFGLGSKTPFAYTDSFTVTAIKDGSRRTYSLIKDGGDLDAVKLSDEPTNEPNGLEVVIPVEKSDFDDFIRETKRQLQFFEVKPKIINGPSNFKFDDPRCHVAYKLPCGVEINNGREDKYGGYLPTYIVQGGVGYPLDYNQLKLNDWQDKKLVAWVRQLQARGMNMYFNIGDISVTPSRENISYDKSTLAHIIDLLTKSYSEFYATIEKDLDALPNNWERAKFVNKIGSLAILSLEHNNKYNLEIKHDCAIVPIFDALTRLTASTDANGVTKMLPQQKFVIAQYTHVMPADRVSRKQFSTALIPKNNEIIIAVDDCVAPTSRIRDYVRNNPDAVVYTLEGMYGTVTQADIDTLSAAIDNGIPVVLASTLPRPVRQYTYTPRASQKHAKLWVLEPGHMVPEKTKDLTAIYDPISSISEAYYLVSEYGKVELPCVSSACIFAEYNAKSKDIDKIELPLIVIRKKDYEKIKDNPKWIPFDTGMNVFIDRLAEEFKRNIPRLAFTKAAENIYGDNLAAKLAGLSDNYIENINNTELKRHIKFARRRQQLLKSRNSLRVYNYAIRCTIEGRFLGQVDALAERFQERLQEKYTKEKFTEKYPLINMHRNFYNADDLFNTHMIQYINFVDSNNSIG